MRWTWRPCALTLVVLALGACSKDDGPSVVEPSSAFLPTGPTGSGGTTGSASGAIGVLPTGPVGGDGPEEFTSGRATVTVSGDLSATATMPNMFSGVFSPPPPPGAMILVWTAGGADASTLGLGGLSFTGTQQSSPSLSLSLTVQTGSGFSSFTSLEGECSITIERASLGHLTGSFACSDLAGRPGEVVDANGTFTARTAEG